ncbi:hypothetical protein R1flu_016665 [Riccia fluitans]|uniref:GRF-type domain-containing protein n=1 Tax=Riccia fluitans TaxID=41844 RepID=A0ABD1YNI0_9MARC
MQLLIPAPSDDPILVPLPGTFHSPSESTGIDRSSSGSSALPGITLADETFSDDVDAPIKVTGDEIPMTDEVVGGAEDDVTPWTGFEKFSFFETTGIISDLDEAVEITGENVTHSSSGLERFSVVETPGFTSDLHVPVADKYVEVTGDKVPSSDKALDVTVGYTMNCSNEPHSLVREGPRGIIEVDLRPEIGPETRESVAEVTPTDNVPAAIREEADANIFGSQSPAKCSGDETSRVVPSVSFCMQPVISLEKRLSGSAKDASLPVAIRTLPLVPSREVAHEQRIDATMLTSYPCDDREGLPSDEVVNKASVEYHEGGCASENNFALGNSITGAELENCDRLGVFADPSVSPDVALTHVDKDFSNTTTRLVDSDVGTQQLMLTEGDSFAVEAGGNEMTVAVKKKLQTKRKKLTDQNIEAEKKKIGLPVLEPVLVGTRLEEATSTRDLGAVLGDAEIHGPEDVSRILNGARNSTVEAETSAHCQAVGKGFSKADDVEEIPSGLTSADQTHGHSLICNCGKPAVLKTVGYKSRNRGLRYYSCERYKPTFLTRKRNRKLEIQNLTSCRFFQWLDSPRVTVEDKKEIRIQKKRPLEQIVADGKAATSYYSTRSAAKHEYLEHEAEKSRGLVPEGVTPVLGFSEELKLSRKKLKLNGVDPFLPDCVAFSTRASAARKRKGPCVIDDPGSSSCGGESSSYEVSMGDWTDSQPGKVARSGKFEAHNNDTPAQTYSRRAKTSLPSGRLCAFKPRPKSVGKLERATADTNHVRKLLPVSLAYQKSREVVLEESSEEEVSGDHKEEASDEEGHFVGVSSSPDDEECVETPSSISVEGMQTDAKSRGRGEAYSETRSGTLAKSSGKLENSIHSLSAVRDDASGAETSLAGNLVDSSTNRQAQWLEVPLTCPFENKEAGCPPAVSGQPTVQHGFDQCGKFSDTHGVIVNFPTPSKVGERRTVASSTLLIVKEKASLAVRKKKCLRRNIDSQGVARIRSTNQLHKLSERGHVSDSDNEETGPKGYRGLRSLKEMLSRESSDGTVADHEVTDQSQPPLCECKTARRPAVLKTVLSKSPNQGLRYWVCVNHRPLYRRKSLWQGVPKDESCKFFRWLDPPRSQLVVSYSQSKKKQLAATRRPNENGRR